MRRAAALLTAHSVGVAGARGGVAIDSKRTRMLLRAKMMPRDAQRGGWRASGSAGGGRRKKDLAGHLVAARIVKGVRTIDPTIWRENSTTLTSSVSAYPATAERGIRQGGQAEAGEQAERRKRSRAPALAPL